MFLENESKEQLMLSGEVNMTKKMMPVCNLNYIAYSDGSSSEDNQNKIVSTEQVSNQGESTREENLHNMSVRYS